jgi:hypothetical protein
MFFEKFRRIKIEINIKKGNEKFILSERENFKISERDILTYEPKINAFENKNIQSIDKRNESLIEKSGRT